MTAKRELSHIILQIICCPSLLQIQWPMIEKKNNFYIFHTKKKIIEKNYVYWKSNEHMHVFVFKAENEIFLSE